MNALECFEEALHIKKRLLKNSYVEMDGDIANLQYNIGICYINMENYSLALESYKKS